MDLGHKRHFKYVVMSIHQRFDREDWYEAQTFFFSCILLLHNLFISINKINNTLRYKHEIFSLLSFQPKLSYEF